MLRTSGISSWWGVLLTKAILLAYRPRRLHGRFVPLQIQKVTYWQRLNLFSDKLDHSWPHRLLASHLKKVFKDKWRGYHCVHRHTTFVTGFHQDGFPFTRDEAIQVIHVKMSYQDICTRIDANMREKSDNAPRCASPLGCLENLICHMLAVPISTIQSIS